MERFGNYDRKQKKKGDKMMEIKEAIEIVTGYKPEEVEENCGTIWFKADNTWYWIAVEECSPDAFKKEEK